MIKHIKIILLFLFFPQFILCSYCGSYIPFSPRSCYEYTNVTSICCHLRGNFAGSPHSMCYPFSRDIYYKMGRSVKINGYKFDIDCGESRGTLCGSVVNPKSYKDCGIFSKKDNSCCFYSYQYKNPGDDDYSEETNCVWLGTGDVGEMSYNKLKIICSINYVKINFIFLFFFLVFLF